METSILLGGYGGQGVQMMGNLLAQALHETGKYVTFIPDYTGRMRGGKSNCTIVAGDVNTAVSLKEKLDILAVLSDSAMEAFENRVLPGGLVVYNSSVIISPPRRSDVTCRGIPGSELAEECGSVKTTNIVMLAFLVGVSGIVPMDAMEKVMMEKLGARTEYLEFNKIAFAKGREYVEKT